MIVYEDEYAIIEHHPAEDLLWMTWKKYTPSTEYRVIVTAFYEWRCATQISRILSDCRLLPTIGTLDSQWTVEMAKKYYDRIPQSKVAVVLAENTFTRLTMDIMVKEFKITQTDYEDKVSTVYFSDVGNAMAWLMRV